MPTGKDKIDMCFGKRANTHKRNLQLLQRYDHLYQVKFLRTQIIVDQLAEEFFLSSRSVEDIIIRHYSDYKSHLRAA